jgi:hypothetical protein
MLLYSLNSFFSKAMAWKNRMKSAGANATKTANVAAVAVEPP